MFIPLELIIIGFYPPPYAILINTVPLEKKNGGCRTPSTTKEMQRGHLCGDHGPVLFLPEHASIKVLAQESSVTKDWWNPSPTNPPAAWYQIPPLETLDSDRGRHLYGDGIGAAELDLVVQLSWAVIWQVLRDHHRPTSTLERPFGPSVLMHSSHTRNCQTINKLLPYGYLT